MALLKIKLTRNLRKTLLRGHPWVYKDSIDLSFLKTRTPFNQLAHTSPQPTAQPSSLSVAKAGGQPAAEPLHESVAHSVTKIAPQLCLVLDQKGEEVAWAMYDPYSPLALRILSLEKTPPQWSYFEGRLEQALRLRQSLFAEETTAYRLINGEGDFLPGLVCDVYGQTLILQFDGRGPAEFWDKDKIADWLLRHFPDSLVYEKSRRSDAKDSHEESSLKRLGGKSHTVTTPTVMTPTVMTPTVMTPTVTTPTVTTPTVTTPEVAKRPQTDNSHESDTAVVQENGVKFFVDLRHGQKTGFFLDQRENRLFVRKISRGKTVLNLFSYTGGFSVYAGLGGASKVTSVDIAAGAIKNANDNWALNNLEPLHHDGICADVFDFLSQTQSTWDHVIVDPPSMGHSEEHKARAVTKYIEAFSAAAKKVKLRGQLSVSSCSSHISFNDFFEIINESLSVARRRGRIIRVSGQGPDHPFPHASHEQRYLKFVHLILD